MMLSHVHPVMIQISLHLQAESSLGAFWLARDAKFLHADNEDSDLALWMHRWFEFVGCTLRRYFSSHVRK